MSKETLGYLKLEWTCPRCGSRNPGPQKTCLSCGAPQPENVAFHLPEKQELLTDEEEIAHAQKGPDIHCPYCGARNPADAEVCVQCGGSLKEGVQRQSGVVVGAFQTGAEAQIICANCAAANNSAARMCISCGAPLPRRKSPSVVSLAGKSKIGWLIAAALFVLLFVCVGFFLFASRTEGVQATVKDAYWQTSLVVEGLRPVERSGWREELPPEATILNCAPKVHHTQEEAAPNANKVCGTPYIVDTGSGYAEVVQDCVYEVLMDYCSYTVMEWQAVETLTRQGKELPVGFASVNLSADQRIGRQTITYICVFDSSRGEMRYTTQDETVYQRCTPQSPWIVEVNPFGQIISFNPR